MRIKERKPDTPMCGKRKSERIFEGEIRNKSHTMLLLVTVFNEDYVQDPHLQKDMKTISKTEKNRGRIETRTAYVTYDTDWLYQKSEWKKLCCIGAIHTQFETQKGKSDEWHCYISNRDMTPDQLLHHARMEWSVESMHWLLDVYFEED